MFNCIARDEGSEDEGSEDEQEEESSIPVLYIAVPTGNEIVHRLNALRSKCPWLYIV